jgi:hypothetical protein
MAAKQNSGNRKVERAMHEMKRGKLKSGRSGKTVKSRKPAKQARRFRRKGLRQGNSRPTLRVATGCFSYTFLPERTTDKTHEFKQSMNVP